MNAYLYKSGKIIEVDTEHSVVLQDKFGISTIREAIPLGFVRIRKSGNMVAFQARSKDLVLSASRNVFPDKIGKPDLICIEYPGRYLEMTFEEFFQDYC